ncbi:MAG: Nif11-like leader peptide family RiPP precursor [Bacillota bacterium]
MSSKFVDFFVKVMETPEAQAKFTEITANGTNDKVFDDLIVFAKDYGYDFTKEEIVEYFKANVSNAELSDDDLEAVAGGKGFRMPEYTNEEFGKAFLSVFGAFL